jgi:hypothetical protein
MCSCNDSSNSRRSNSSKSGISYSSSNRETKLEVLGGYNEVTENILLHIRETSCQTHRSEVIVHTYPRCFWGMSKFKPFSENGSILRN